MPLKLLQMLGGIGGWAVTARIAIVRAWASVASPEFGFTFAVSLESLMLPTVIQIRHLAPSLLCLVLLGCNQGPPLGQVSGTITLDGAPLEKATITFTHVEEERQAFARTDANGYYELQFTEGGRSGALLGENVVSIETARVGTDAEGNLVEFPEILPKKYHVETEITRDIKGGKQTIDFELSK